MMLDSNIVGEFGFQKPQVIEPVPAPVQQAVGTPEDWQSGTMVPLSGISAPLVTPKANTGLFVAISPRIKSSPLVVVTEPVEIEVAPVALVEPVASTLLNGGHSNSSAQFKQPLPVSEKLITIVTVPPAEKNGQ